MTLVLGVDGGGTSCRAALSSVDGRVLGRATSGAANINTDFESATANIVDAAKRALAEAGLDSANLGDIVAVLGLAGANVGDSGRRLETALPFRRSIVETDAMIALEGAVGVGDGAIAILGTGTAYLRRRAGVATPVGGWGFLVGDQGSGAQIGRETLERTLLAVDRVGAESNLTDEISAHFGGDPGRIVQFASSAKPGDFGIFAPKAFAHAALGDEIALAILQRGLQVIEATIERLELLPAEPLCLLGGLAPHYEQLLSEKLQRHVRPAKQDALGGAVSMARRLLA